MFGDLAQGGMLMIKSSTSPKRRPEPLIQSRLSACNAHSGCCGH